MWRKYRSRHLQWLTGDICSDWVLLLFPIRPRAPWWRLPATSRLCRVCCPDLFCSRSPPSLLRQAIPTQCARNIALPQTVPLSTIHATHCVLKYTVSPENTRLCCGPWNWKCSLPGILTCPSSHSVIKRWRSDLFWPGLASAEPHRWQNDAPASKEKCRRSRETIYPLYMQFSSWKWIQLKTWPGIPGWHPASPWFPEPAVILTGHIPPLVTGLLSEELLCPCPRTILPFLNAQYYGRNIGFN